MSDDTEDFEKLQKVLKLKRYEQPPPGYFNRFSSVVINRLEKENHSKDIFADVPWLRKLFGIFESSPMAAGLFGSVVCGLVIFGVVAANQADKLPINAFVPVNSTSTTEVTANASLAVNSDSQVFGRSTDPIFVGASIPGSPSSPGNDGNSTTARIEPVSFTPAPQ